MLFTEHPKISGAPVPKQQWRTVEEGKKMSLLSKIRQGKNPDTKSTATGRLKYKWIITLVFSVITQISPSNLLLSASCSKKVSISRKKEPTKTQKPTSYYLAFGELALALAVFHNPLVKLSGTLAHLKRGRFQFCCMWQPEHMMPQLLNYSGCPKMHLLLCSTFKNT